VYFIKWSMDVKFEGENVDRHLDMTTDNHNSPNANEAVPWIYTDSAYLKNIPAECHANFEKARTACRDEQGPQPPDRCSQACEEAQVCVLIKKSNDKSQCCAPNTTGHHLIEDQWVKENPNFPWYSSDRGSPDPLTRVPSELPGRARSEDPADADIDDAPTVCANPSRTVGTAHRDLHDVQGVIVEQFQDDGPRAALGQPSNGFNYGQAKESVVMAHTAAFPDSNCSQNCIKHQLDAFYGADNSRPMNLPTRKQGLKDQRDQLHDTWGNINRGPLTHNPFANLKLPG